MVDDVQPSDPPADLLDVARRVVPVWLHRVVTAACRRGGVDPAAFGTELDAMVADVAVDLLARLADLLAADVDAQRTTPLALLREAVVVPAAWLDAHDVPRPGTPSDGSFPGDPYRLGPATWSDIDAAMHESGITWGAWKAMTILARRRDVGLR